MRDSTRTIHIFDPNFGSGRYRRISKVYHRGSALEYGPNFGAIAENLMKHMSEDGELHKYVLDGEVKLLLGYDPSGESNVLAPVTIPVTVEPPSPPKTTVGRAVVFDIDEDY